MMLVLIVIGLAFCVGFIVGGSLRPFEHLKVRWWGLALAGLAVQGISLADLGRPAGTALLVGSYGLLVAFAWVNRRLPALWLAMVGLVLNILVIGANGGMPVSASALETAGARAEGLVGDDSAKHHLMGPDDKLTPLGDVIEDPPPIGAVSRSAISSSTPASRSSSWRSCSDASARIPRHRVRCSRGTGGSICLWIAASPVGGLGRRLLLEEGSGEPDRDGRSLTGCTHDLEATTTHLRAFAHHRHAEVTLRAGGGRVEADAVVLEAQHDVLVFLANREPHVPGLRVFEGVHHALASDVIHEQGDRGRELDVLHVAMESDRGVAADLVGEGFESLRETLRSERRTMQDSDERPDPVDVSCFDWRILSS